MRTRTLSLISLSLLALLTAGNSSSGSGERFRRAKESRKHTGPGRHRLERPRKERDLHEFAIQANQNHEKPSPSKVGRPQLIAQMGYSNGVTSVAFSPDGRLVLAGSQDKSARLWETATGLEVRRFVDPEDEVEAVAFSTDGRFVMTRSRKALRVWNAATGQEVRRFQAGASTDGHMVLEIESRKITIARDAASARELYRFEMPVDGDASADGRFNLSSENVTDGSGHRSFVTLREVRTGRSVRFEGHAKQIVSKALSPDAGLLVTASFDKTVRLWNAATGKEVRRLAGHSEMVSSIVFSIDGRMILTGSDDRTARLWEAATGRELRRFEGHPERVSSVAISTDGRFALAENRVFDNKWSRVWNLATGEETQRFEGASSPDGRMFLQTDVESQVAIIRDKTTGKVWRRFEINSGRQAFSPDGRLVLEGEGHSQLIAVLKDVATGKEMRRFKGHADVINSLAFSPDGGFALTGSGYGSYKDNTVRLWDVATGQEVRRFEGMANLVHSVAFSPDGRLLIAESGAFDSLVGQMGSGGARLDSVFLWDLTTGQQVRNLSGGLLDMTCAAYSPDGRFLLTGRWEIAQLWDVATGQEAQRFARHSGWVRAVAFSSDGRFVMTGSADSTARLWDAATGQEMQRFVGHSGVVRAVAFSPDSRFVVTASSGSDDQTVRLWEVETGKEARRIAGFPPLKFSPDGRLLITDSASGPVAWETATGKEAWRLEGHKSSIDSVALSADGRWLLTGDSDHTARLWDLASRKKIQEFPGHTSTVRAVALSPDGQYALSGSGGVLQEIDMTVRLWDIASGRELRRFGESAFPAFSVAFSPDGRLVFAYSMNVYGSDQTGLLGRGIAQLFDAATGKEMRRFGDLSPRGYADFSQDGNFAVMSRQDRASRLMDAATGHPLQIFGGTSAAVSPDGRFVVTGRKGLAVSLWDSATGREIRRFNERPDKTAGNEKETDSDDDDEDFVTKLAFSPDGRFIAMGSDQGSIHLWEVATGQRVQNFKGHEASGTITSITFSLDGRFMFTTSKGDPDTSARMWEVATGNEARRFEMDDDNEYRYNVTSVALSPDGRLGLTWGFNSGIDQMVFEDATTPRLWDATSDEDRELRRLVGHTDDVYSAAFSSDGRLVATGSKDGSTRLWETATGKELCRLLSFRDGSWVVVDSDGRFDTNNLEGIQGLHWIFPADPFKPLPLEIFMRDYYEPRLLSRILAGEGFKPIRSLATLNRRQPQVKITRIESKANAPDLVTVTVEVAEIRGAGRQNHRQAAPEAWVYDLRLFRNGQLVGYAPKTGGRLHVNRRTGRAAISFTDIKLPRRRDIATTEFSAYAFNQDRVKSATDRKVIKLPQSLKPVGGRVYLITVGVEAYENPDWNLSYPANDARGMQRTLRETLLRTGSYEEIVGVSLISEIEEKPDAAAPLPTKGNFQTVLDLLAGKSVGQERLKRLTPQVAEKIRPARPEDLVLISFSSHGYADQRGNFYLFPYDLGPARGRAVTPALLRRAISSDELSFWLRDVDAGEIVMIVDACHSAAAVEREGFKPGPMGSRGLGQLSYDKGMRILAATQADNVAVGSGLRRHGLLSYALTRDGLDEGKADLKPEDRRITLSEWLRYGKESVPELYKKEYPQEERGKIQRPTLFDFARRRQEVTLLERK